MRGERADGIQQRMRYDRRITRHHEGHQGIAHGTAEPEDHGDDEPPAGTRQQHPEQLLGRSQPERTRTQTDLLRSLAHFRLEGDYHGGYDQQGESNGGSHQAEPGALIERIPDERNQDEHRDEAVDDRGNAGHEIYQRAHGVCRPGWGQALYEAGDADRQGAGKHQRQERQAEGACQHGENAEFPHEGFPHRTENSGQAPDI